MKFNSIYIIFFLLLSVSRLIAQEFYLGADMSYVNEMEDCGVTYFEQGLVKDPYAIFADRNANLVRLRLWHTPDWYDNLNQGNRYSDLNDVKRAITRVKDAGMETLLNFHLSDNWADPGSQLVPRAWIDVVDDLDILSDSLYQYISEVLFELDENNLLPEMIQIGNETNKGILLSPEDNSTWILDWPRNARLFNSAIRAVRDFEQSSGNKVEIMLHVANPSNAEWMVDGFVSNGVVDFDHIGLSYYWAWHMPTSISQAGDVIASLRSRYPDKGVIVVETGYIWTSEWNDNANNIINELHPDYSPASPENQRDWLIDLTKEVMQSGGQGVIYWEPCWQSSTCWTQWGQGSHQEHATFFDFDNELLFPGGIEWLEYEYGESTGTDEEEVEEEIMIWSNSFSGDIKLVQNGEIDVWNYLVADSLGNTILNGVFKEEEKRLNLQNEPFGIYIISARNKQGKIASKKFLYSSK